MDNHGWDHESGIEGFSVDKAFLLRKKIPANVSGQVSVPRMAHRPWRNACLSSVAHLQVTKDKKDANLTLETEASMKHSDKLITTSGLDIQTVGKQLAYTVRSETRWKNRSNNKTTGGLSASLIGGTLAFGAKVEDRCAALCSVSQPVASRFSGRWKVRPGSKLVVSCGAITAKGDVAFGAPRLPRGGVSCTHPGCLQVATARASCASKATRPAPPAPPWAHRS